MLKFLFESDRLSLRELNSNDIEDLFDILSDSETMRYYPKPYNHDEATGWINGAMKSYEKHGFGLWAVILKEENQFIGQCGISYQNIDDVNVPEIGYHINKMYWNKGFATEASKLSMKNGFSRFGLGEIFINTWVKNIPSYRVAEKIGMTKRKVYDKKIQNTNIIMQHVVYSMTLEEYQKMANQRIQSDSTTPSRNH